MNQLKPNQPEGFETLDPTTYLSILRHSPDWVFNPTITELLDSVDFNTDTKNQTQKQQTKRAEVVRLFEHALEHNLIALENKPEFYNDDDRWDPMNWDSTTNSGISWLSKKPNAMVEKPYPDTAVIHHTSTNPDATYSYLNALGLLRLYYPLFKTKALPVASGHTYNGNPTFVGYHYLVREDGTVEQTLNTSYTGFHAGNYTVNCRSIGIAVVGDLTDTKPNQEVINAIRTLLSQHNIKTILGHQDVKDPRSNQNIATSCPGEHTWQKWKHLLLD